MASIDQVHIGSVRNVGLGNSQNTTPVTQKRFSGWASAISPLYCDSSYSPIATCG